MFYAKNDEIFSLCAAVKYTYEKTTPVNYTQSPRPCHNFVFMLEGKARIHSDGNEFYLKKGDILYIPQGSTYLAEWIAPPTAIFHSIHFNFRPAIDPFLHKKIPVQLLPNEDFEELYQEVERLQAFQYAKNSDSFFAVASFYRLCGKLLQNAAVTDNENEHPILPAINEIQNNPTVHYTVKDLAELCFLSESRFFYLFKKYTGESPISYKNRLAVQYAAQALLLEKHRSVENIAQEYGFDSAVYFRRLFKKIMHKTPTQYRKEESLL